MFKLKKRVFKLIITIAIIFLVTIIIINVIPRSKEEFPHNKQAMLQLQGSINVVKDEEFTLPFIFLDEYDLSEMASPDNIKSLNIVDNKGKSMKIRKWSIEKIRDYDNYTTRKLDVVGILNEVATYEPANIVITFNDGKEKKYDIGEFKILCYDNENESNEFYCLQMNAFPERSIKEIPNYFQLLIKNIENKNITIEEISTGVSSFGIDNCSYHVIKDALNSQFLVDAINKNESWIKGITDATKVDVISDKITPFTVKEKSMYEPECGCIAVHLTREASLNENSIFIFNFKLKIDQGGTKKIFYKMNPCIVISRLNDEEAMIKYLKEAGI